MAFEPVDDAFTVDGTFAACLLFRLIASEADGSASVASVLTNL
jgi:hypothetical protein